MSETPRSTTNTLPQDLPHNYARTLMALLAAGAGLVGAEPHCVTIAHDDWCGVLQGTGRCTCDPEVTTQPIRMPEEEPRHGRP